jgi:hypothetical protein
VVPALRAPAKDPSARHPAFSAGSPAAGFCWSTTSPPPAPPSPAPPTRFTKPALARSRSPSWVPHPPRSVLQPRPRGRAESVPAQCADRHDQRCVLVPAAEAATAWMGDRTGGSAGRGANRPDGRRAPRPVPRYRQGPSAGRGANRPDRGGRRGTRPVAPGRQGAHARRARPPGRHDPSREVLLGCPVIWRLGTHQPECDSVGAGCVPLGMADKGQADLTRGRCKGRADLTRGRRSMAIPTLLSGSC